MKTIVRILLLIVITLFFLMLCKCSERSECDMSFAAYKTENFTIFVNGNFPSDTKFEIWASHIQDTPYPIPGLFINIGSQSDYVNGEMRAMFRDDYLETFHYDAKEGYYFYAQIRIKNTCGYSAFKTYLVRVNHEITKREN